MVSKKFSWRRNELVPVIISSVLDPSDFYICPLRDRDCVNGIKSFKGFTGNTNLAVFHGGIYLYKLNEDYYRIKLFIESDQHFAFFLDLGGKLQPISKSGIVSCPAGLRNLRPMAHAVSLADVCLTYGDWSPKLLAIFMTYLSSSNSMFKAEIIEPGVCPMKILLFDSFGSLSEMFFNALAPNIMRIPTPVNKTLLFPRIARKDIPCLPIIDFEPGQTITGTVSSVSEDLYFCFSMENYGEALKDTKAIVDKTCRSLSIAKNNDPFPSEIVVSKFMKKWVRCEVYDYANPWFFRLRDIDGTNHFNNVSHTFYLPPSLETLTTYMLHCRLVGYDDDVFLGKTLLEFGDTITIEVLEIKDNTLFIDICEN